MAAAAQSSGPNFDLIENSLRFRGGQHLTRTNASAPTNQYKATFSVWVKVSGRKVNGDNCILQNSQPGGPPYSNGALYYETNSGWYQFVISDNSNPSTRTGRNSIRDHSAWYHVVFAFDHTQSTSEDGMKIYVNGLQRNGPAYGGETAGGWADAQNQALSWLINGRTIAMGHSHTENNGNFDGYMAEFHCIDGQMLDPTSFGEYEENGVWIPKKVSGIAYGNNGWYLDFSDPSNIGADRSGNGNNWTPSGFELSNTTSTNYDWMEDTPTKNFGTWNPLGRAHPSMSNQVADADLKLNFSRANGDYAASTTYMMHPDDTTNYYWEIKFTNMDFGASVGVVEYPWIWNTSPCVRWNSWTGNVGNHPSNVDGNPIANIGTFGNNDIIGCAWNGTNKSIQFYKNGTVVGTPYSPASTEGRIFTPTTNGAGNTQTFEFNTGNRPLAYTPPSGYVPLSTAEMSDVPIKDPSDHFQTVLDTGANILSSAQSTFSNGLWWIKDRTQNSQHFFVDSVRGGNLALDTPAQGAEHSYSAPSGNSVAWCWNLVTGRTNGFDIVTYTGSGSARTVSHNLSQAPEYMIVRKRDNGGDYFITYHVTPGPQYGTQLNSYQSSSNQAFWNNTAPTSSVFTVGTENSTNASGAGYVAYLWHSIPGYSAMGGYQGNGSSDGPFIYLGFRPAYVYIKNWGSPGTEAGIIYDSTRSTYNPNDTTLFPQNEWSEAYINSVYTQPIDMLSNGFKIRGTESRYNNSSYQYFYVAYAEHPFGGANVSPSPAR